MQYRLLSLLTEIEKSIQAGTVAAGGVSLDSSRMVNYHTGMARLTFQVQAGAGLEPRGHIQLQHFHLADGRPCVKVTLAWAGSEQQRSIGIYTLPGLNWSTEVQRVAEAWLDGPSQVSELESTVLAVAS